MGNTRINVQVTNETDLKLEKWAKKLGMSKSQLASLAIMAGLDNILKVASPSLSEGWNEIKDQA